MRFLDNMERKLGRFAIHGLMRYIIVFYIIGYIFYYTQSGILNYLTLEPYRIFHNGQAWRLISWVLMPPNHSNIIFIVIMLVLYYQLGTALERSWGAFRFNLYIFGGVIFSIAGALILYAVEFFGFHRILLFGSSFSTYYINLSIFLAFAVAFPDMQVRLYFIIPIKMKWMALVYAALLVYEFVITGLAGRVAIVTSLGSFLIYFLATRNFKRFSPKQVRRRRNFRRSAGGSTSRGARASSANRSRSASSQNRNRGASTQNRIHVSPPGSSGGSYSRTGSGPIHKCAICGRTELDDPNLTFRYCSKCNGNYEYCQDHLFTHEHIK